MEPFSDYAHAIVSLAGLVLLWAVLNPLSAILKEKAGAAPGGAPPESDYASRPYRAFRAYSNLTETLPAFAAALTAAILAGANPFWVNLLASIFFVSRIVVAYVHIQGIGKASGGLRSLIFALGWATCIGLAVVAAAAAF